MININKKISKILLIDDDEISNFYHEYLLQDKLKFEGEIQVCLNGKEGLNCLTNSQKISGEREDPASPDLVLLDINMPIMNGFEFIKEYAKIKKKIQSKVIICMLTSSLNDQDRIKVMQIGNVDYFMTKPLEEEQLLEIIHKEFK
jgi:DNA-binding response OmpR family regulator